MSTRSSITIKELDGSVKSIYCHADGYPEHNGKILNEHYTDVNKVRELIGLGDLSYLGPNIGVKQDFNNPDYNQCRAYGRDRGETGTEATPFVSKQDYNYTFNVKTGLWTCRKG
jgi:hypothetical protein